MGIRIIEEDFIKKFEKDGIFENFLKFVKLPKYNKDLILLFRNSSGNATIYYRNHKVFELSNKGVVAISFNHARYSKNYSKYIDILIDYGFRQKEGSIEICPQNGSIGVLKSKRGKFALNEIVELYEKCIKNYLNDYFNASNTKSKVMDYFKNTSNPKKMQKPGSMEKTAQQVIFSDLKNLVNGYFVIDLEYHVKGDRSANCPDFIAVRFNNSKPEAIVVGEVKSKDSALKYGKSNIYSHYDKMKKEFKKVFKPKDCEEIMDLYKRLNLYGVKQNYKIKDKYEIMIVLTDEVKNASISDIKMIDVTSSIKTMSKPYKYYIAE